MVGVTTVALIERKHGMPRALFTRYWRDVHGVMAARVPGFESYTQHHVSPIVQDAAPFEGIAVVTFAGEPDRQALVSGPLTPHIYRDEVNVFHRALLYNLAEGATEVLRHGARAGETFVIVRAGGDPAVVARTLLDGGASWLVRHDLRSGDPSKWNDTDVGDGARGYRFAYLFHAGWTGAEPNEAAIASLVETGALPFRHDETHIMVERGRPTAIGLRGLDVVRTIREAGADNQLAGEVERALYGRDNPLSI